MSDIVERLRELDKSKHIGYRVGWQRKAGADCNAAADEIAALRAEVAGLREQARAGRCPPRAGLQDVRRF